MFSFLVSVGFAVLMTVMVVQFVVSFRKAEGTVWERMLATSRESATWLWSKVLLFSGAAIEVAQSAANYLNLPEVTEFIRTSVPPEYLGYALMGIALVTLISRFRTLVD